jgi:hypothetical protein
MTIDKSVLAFREPRRVVAQGQFLLQHPVAMLGDPDDVIAVVKTVRLPVL